MAKLLALILTVALSISSASGQERVETAVVFLADVSASMHDWERDIVRDSHVAAIASDEVCAHLDSGSSAAFAYIEFAAATRVVVNWRRVTSCAEAQAFAHAVSGAIPIDLGGGTNVAAALRAAFNALERLPFETEHAVIDIATDTAHSDESVRAARQALLARGATINAVPLLLSPTTNGNPARAPSVQRFLREEVIGGPGAFVVELLAEEPDADSRGIGSMRLVPPLRILLVQKIARELY